MDNIYKFEFNVDEFKSLVTLIERKIRNVNWVIKNKHIDESNKAVLIREGVGYKNLLKKVDPERYKSLLEFENQGNPQKPEPKKTEDVPF